MVNFAKNNKYITLYMRCVETLYHIYVYMLKWLICKVYRSMLYKVQKFRKKQLIN